MIYYLLSMLMMNILINNFLEVVIMNELMVFNNAEFGQVRTMEINGEPWFVGKDVAEALGYSNSSKAVSVHVDNEDKQFVMIDIAHSHFGNMPIGQSKTAIINESGVYALIFGSKLPNARKFKHWVTSEILPTIRKTGSYSITQTKTDSYMIENPAERARRWAEEYEEKLALECKIAEQQPKVEYHDAVLNKSGLLTTTAIAKDLGFKSAKQLNDLLKRDKVIYKKSDTYYLYADYEYLITEGYCDYKSYKNENSSLSLQWTEKGRKWLKERYCA